MRTYLDHTNPTTQASKGRPEMVCGFAWMPSSLDKASGGTTGRPPQG